MAPEGADEVWDDKTDPAPETVRMPTSRPPTAASGLFEVVRPEPAVLRDGVLWAPEVAPENS